MITIRNYKRVESLEEAWKLIQQRNNPDLGGMLWLKMGKGTVQTAIDLSGLSLDVIEENEGEFRIGCMVTLRQLEQHQELNQYTGGAMREAVRHIVGVQFRNLATVGGSVYGRFGFSDVLTAFLAMDSYVELYQGGIVPMREFAASAFDRDILVRVIIKKTPGCFTYHSVRNTQTDFPVLTCAAARYEEDGRVQLAVGARPGRAILMNDEKQLLAGEWTQDKIEAFAAFAQKQVPTGSNTRGTAEYRSHLVKVLTKRAMMELGGSSL